VPWRRRPAGDFSPPRTLQKRRRDAGATKKLLSLVNPMSDISPIGCRGVQGDN
jgi:hypothetical protein